MQSKLLRFHEAIKLTESSHNSTLREKREAIKTRLRGRMPVTFTTFNQGSYAMSTGIRPLDGDYDIDVGIVLNVDSVPTPIQAKRWVHDAVKDHTTRVKWRGPCITVYYQRSGRVVYHVDLPVYIRDRRGLWLALGKEHAANPEWRHEDPQGFIKGVQNHLSGEDRNQFRRVLRALKRWRDVHFTSEGNASPVGIGLTVRALRDFQPMRSGWGTGAADYDDLGALRNFVRAMLNGFDHRGRLVGKMPVAPNDDVFGRMTDNQMYQFKRRLATLDGWLEQAARSGQTGTLVRAFGSDFPG